MWALCAHIQKLWVLNFALPSPVRSRVAETGQGILTNMFEHVAAQRIVRVYEEA
jgi:hypothetical protein